MKKLTAGDGIRRTRVAKLIRALKKLYPNAGMALRYGSDWELLVAVMLSAQCTDKKVNEVTARLFKKYRTLDEYVRASHRTFERDIHSTGFYRNKAKNILAAARMVRDEFGGKVPKTMAEVLRIPGVARKTANVVLGNAHGVVDGIAVDTHVRRFALKFNLSDHRDPVRIERDLMRIVPKRDWFHFTYLVIEYGRNMCPGRVHHCVEHPLSKIYPPAAKHFPRARS